MGQAGPDGARDRQRRRPARRRPPRRDGPRPAPGHHRPGLPRARLVITLGPDIKDELPVLYLRLRQAAVEDGLPVVELTPAPTGLSRYAARDAAVPPGRGRRCWPPPWLAGADPTGEVGGVAAADIAAARAASRRGTGKGRPGRRRGRRDRPPVAGIERSPGGRGRRRAGGRSTRGGVPVRPAPGQRARRPRHGPGPRRAARPGDASADGRAWYEHAWGGALPDGPGLDTAGILDRRVGGRIGGLVLLGADPLVRLPRPVPGQAGPRRRPLRRRGRLLPDRILPPGRRGPAGGDLRRAARHVHQPRGPHHPAGPDGHAPRGGLARLDDRRRAGRPPRGRPRLRQPRRHLGRDRPGLARPPGRDPSPARPLARPGTAWSSRSATARSASSPAPAARAAVPAEIDLATDAGAGVEQPVPAPIDPMADPGIGSVEAHGVPATALAPIRLGAPATARPADGRTEAGAEDDRGRRRPGRPCARFVGGSRRVVAAAARTPTRCGSIADPARCGTPARWSQQSPHLAGLHPDQRAAGPPVRPRPPRRGQRRPGAGDLGPGQPGPRRRRRSRRAPGDRRRCCSDLPGDGPADLIDANGRSPTCAWRRCDDRTGRADLMGDPLFANGVNLAVVLIILLKTVVVFVIVLVSVLFMVMYERKVIAYLRHPLRPQPGRPQRLAAVARRRHQAALQGGVPPPEADKRRLPAGALPDRSFPAFLAFAIVPIGGTITIAGHTTRLQLADPPWGILLPADDVVDRRVRRDAGRLVVGVQVPAARLGPGQRPRWSPTRRSSA